MVKKLALMPYAQAKVEIREYVNPGAIDLISYKTRVATISPDGWLTILGLYSHTTRRHIGAFMREYTGCTYQTAKQLYLNDWKMNIHSGEIVPVQTTIQGRGSKMFELWCKLSTGEWINLLCRPTYELVVDDLRNQIESDKRMDLLGEYAYRIISPEEKVIKQVFC